MTDEELILKAESLGYKFTKHKNSWVWSAVAPWGDHIVSENAAERMQWLRDQLASYETIH